ncbi:MAG: hypothetical protein H7240_03225, partial [Glaciimonas sp.]|nr:hypothetical protein [Glaciimonas sp.]
WPSPSAVRWCWMGIGRFTFTPYLISLLTVAYSIDQVIGPPFATHLMHRTGSFTPSLIVAHSVCCWLARACLVPCAGAYKEHANQH